jgi:hypothetical protein
MGSVRGRNGQSGSGILELTSCKYFTFNAEEADYFRIPAGLPHIYGKEVPSIAATFQGSSEGNWIQNRAKIGKVAYVWRKLKSCKSVNFNAGDGNRTHTPLAGPRILSPF